MADIRFYHLTKKSLEQACLEKISSERAGAAKIFFLDIEFLV